VLRYVFISCALFFMCSVVQAGTICTVVADARDHTFILKDGNCSERVTPASTFKIALSLMGYDSKFLKDESKPTLVYQRGDPDWGGTAWLQPTNPSDWMKYSVVWYSHRVTHFLGEPRLADYTRAFSYGNADVSGDAGKHNGIDRAWISSSLKISPLEQIDFIIKLVNKRLPISQHAIDTTMRLTEVVNLPGGWAVHGKTGTAFPRDEFGKADQTRGYGWFVGWATKGARTIVFARLSQDTNENSVPAGKRVRDALLGDWVTIMKSQ